MLRYNVELRAEVSGDKLAGYASVFNRHARIGSSWEQIAPTAFDAALKRNDDVRALINHDPTLLLGRSLAGTLRLGVDAEGLQFEVDLPDTQYARDLRVLVERGDLSGASFGFVPGEDSYERAPDGRQLRTHTSVARLLDVSAVTYPAYEEAGVALRSVDWSTVSPDFVRENRSKLIQIRHRIITER